MKQIHCELVSINEEGITDRLYYTDNKDRRVKFKTLFFQYYLHSAVLKDELQFYVGIYSNNTVIQDSSIIKGIPECIRRNWTCNFLNSEDAKRIAIRDSIKYPDNLSCELERNKIDKEYYWVITGHKKEKLDPVKSKVPILRASLVTSSMTRIIHATTGVIVKEDQFDYDW
jgi:hypothetical protein